MSAAFGFLSFIAFIAMIIGLIKPTWLKLATRSKVLMWYGGAFAILFAIGIAIPNNPTQPTNTNTEAAPVVQAPSPTSTPNPATAQQATTPTPTPAKTTAVQTPTPAPVTEPAQQPAPAPTQPQTVLDVSGSGTKSTQTFTVNDSWQMKWSYDCSNFGYQGNFQVAVYDADGSPSMQNVDVNQLGMSDSDTEYYHTGGTFYLEVNSECNWHVTVQD